MRESRVRVRHPPGISATLLLDILPPYNLTTTDENYVRADLGYVLLEEANYIPHHALITAKKKKKNFCNHKCKQPLSQAATQSYLHPVSASLAVHQSKL